MDATITDPAALRRATPAKVAAYLQAKGWACDETWRNRIAVWRKQSNGLTHQLLAPLIHHSVSYDLRLSEILAALSQLERRSQLDIHADIIAE